MTGPDSGPDSGPDVGPVGASVPRKDGWAKVSGGERFLADTPATGQWVGGVLRARTACGRLSGLRRDPAFDWSSVAVLTADDLPGPNAVAMIVDDYRILAADDIRFATEALALVAAPDPATLAAALAALTPEIEAATPVLTLDESQRGDRVIWGDDNVVAEYELSRGDPDAGFNQAIRTVEGIYHTSYQEHAYLEPQGVIATPRPDGGVDVLGSMQCPYYVRRALAVGLGLPPEQVVVHQSPTGGAFGGKEDYPSVLALHAALLALRCNRPVRMILDRQEDMAVTTKRHPSRTRIRTALDAEGHLLAMDVDLLMDAGACTTMSPVVLQRAVLHAAGCYRIDHVRIRGRALATNTPPNGAFRGFGVPQAIYAAERHMDRIARELDIDPVDLRRRNLLQDGDVLPCGQVLEDAAGAALVLDRTAELAGPRPQPSPARPAEKIGRGLALFFHGGGFTGSGETRISARVRVRVTSAGEFEILTSNVEMGQGAATVLPMVAAEALGLPLDLVRCAPIDTSVVPDSGPTVASRTTIIVGQIIVEACSDWLENLLVRVAARRGVDRASLSCRDGHVFTGAEDLGPLLEVAVGFADIDEALEGEAVYRARPGLGWDDETFRGDAYPAYSWGAVSVDVAVDADTLAIRTLRAVSVVEIGRAIHPVLAAGQVEGGLVQALGWGSCEELQVTDGRYVNDRFATYVIPTAVDAPDLEVQIAEIPFDGGPFGAKGLGELPMNGGAPALAAAVTDAVGLFAERIPVTPEQLLDLQMNGERGPAKGPGTGGRA